MGCAGVMGVTGAVINGVEALLGVLRGTLW